MGTQQIQESTGQQLAVLAQAAANLLHGAELWQRAQLQMLSTGTASLREAAGELRSAGNWMDLVSIQNKLVLANYLSGLQIGSEFLQGWARVQPEQLEPVEEEATTVADAMAPMMQAWQNMFTAAAGSRAMH